MEQRKPDFFLLFLFFLILLFGFLILSSASFPYAERHYNQKFYFLQKQAISLFLGLFFGFIFYKIKLPLLKKISPFLFIFSLFLISLVFFPNLSLKIYGAKRWILIKNFSLQPTELTKPFLILFFAKFLSQTKTEKNKMKNFIFLLLFLGIYSILLCLQKDGSNLFLMFSIILILYFLSNAPLIYFLITALAGAFGAFLLIKFFPYRLNRILTLLNPDLDPMGIGYHFQQALIAVGSAGILGKGFGMSQQKSGFLPHPITDSIFAVFAEETGFLGSVFLLILFFTFFICSVRLAFKTKDEFSKLTIFGISLWIIFQTLMNIGSMIGLFPISGINLPFVSYGGSSLIGQIIGVCILLNVSKSLK